MKLKSLEIEGFKSFADKTLIAFDHHISGIVGPNGCGKSNVVDAIRWVLGEQSSKNLRGKNMEDVIFSGTSERGPGAAASIELTLLNQGDVLPSQYANCQAISVGRKLFRNGASEYYINRQTARLKDVRELFLGTGVGVNAYSIIEQGKVGEIIMARPEDRRSIIEEAAGISKFQMRKAAAERKMDATRQNLLRLKDVLAELERQKISLERQARKAEKFKVLRDEVRMLDLTLASRDFANQTDSEKTHLTKLKELDVKLVAAGSSLSEKENDFAAKRLGQAELEAALGDVQHKVFEWSNVHTVCEAVLSRKRAERERLVKDREVEQSRVDEFKKQDADVFVRWQALVSQLVEADLNLVQSEEELQTLEETLGKIQELAREPFATLATAREDHAQASQNLAKMAAQRGAAESRLAELRSEKISLTGEWGGCADRINALDGLLRRSQGSLADVRQLKLAMDSHSTALTGQVEQVEQKLMCEQSALACLKEELLQKKSRMDSLRELESNFEGYQDGPKAILEKRRAGKADYVLGAVADFIETAPEFENALSAVLGERTQYLIVRQFTESLSATELLREIGTGRGSFVALEGCAGELETVARTLPAGVEINDGVQGYLSRFVGFKAGFEKLKPLLLGDYILVGTLSQAIAVWQNHRLPVVTAAGEIITSDGVLSGGSLEKTSKALLEKKREIKELDVFVTDLVNQLKAREEICFDLTRKLKSLKIQIDDVKNNIHEEDLKMATHEKDIHVVVSQVQGLKESSQRISGRLVVVDAELARLTCEVESLQVAQACEIRSLAAAAGLIAAKQGEEDNFRARIAAQSEALMQTRIATASLKIRQAEFQREVERLCRERTRLQNEIIAGEETIVLLTKLMLFYDDRLGFIAKNLTRILSVKQALDHELDARKNVFSNLNQQVLSLEVELKSLRSELGSRKDAINASTLGLTEVRNQMVRLRDQIFERYQIFIAEVYAEHLNVKEGFDEPGARVRIEEFRQQMARAGNVNLGAIDELREVSERFDFLNRQRIDLEASLDALTQAIEKINETTKTRFTETFALINEKFGQLFPKLFNGGDAYLKLTDPDNVLAGGVEIIAQPPGKKLQSMTLLSGGEKALTAVGLLFAIFLIKPSPFCLLDEVDAPLDDANVDRYNDIVSEMSQRTQFIVITHNKRTMQVTSTLFGVTMEKPGISQIVSVNLDG